MRSLPKSWAPIKNSIQEAKDLSFLSLEELLGSLLIHEMSMKEEEEKEGKKKKKEISIALKATCISRLLIIMDRLIDLKT